ncbi:hypothetical protein T11_4853 [Trichinella zimbabwensis]|uniref:Uncharacterized protein n=1 Tax=Trichinella zimbabwensis TaxID=268475 RepID=A0A0V1H5F1_9BILA|nr:hypothetical protein T11_4853 [Trichinella zimbabwensis]
METLAERMELKLGLLLSGFLEDANYAPWALVRWLWMPFEASSMCRQRIKCSSFFSPMSGICYTAKRSPKFTSDPPRVLYHTAVSLRQNQYGVFSTRLVNHFEVKVSHPIQQADYNHSDSTISESTTESHAPGSSCCHRTASAASASASKSTTRRLLDRSCFFRVRAVALIMQRIPERPGLQAMQHICEPFQVPLLCLYEDDDSMIQIDEASFPCQPVIAVVIISWNTAGALQRLNGIILNHKSACFPRCKEVALRQSDSQLPISEDGQRILPEFLRTSTTDDGFKHTSLKHFAQNMDYDSIMRKREIKRWLSLWAGSTHLDFRPHQIHRVGGVLICCIVKISSPPASQVCPFPNGAANTCIHLREKRLRR